MTLCVTEKFPDQFSNRYVSGLLLFMGELGCAMRDNELPFKVSVASSKMKEGL